MSKRIVPIAVAALGAAAVLTQASTAIAAECTPERQLAAADAYIAALGDKTLANTVPFAPDAIRIENGLQTGFSGEGMRRDLELHLQYSVMTTPVVHSREVAPGGNPDLLRYRFTVPVVIAGHHIVNAPTDETFRIPRSSCLIERIDATITVAPV